MLRVCLAQVNPTVGDLGGNTDKIIRFIEMARKRRADIVVFPELCLSGYPPEDLLLKPHFIAENRAKLRRIIKASQSIFCIVGFPNEEKGRLFNSCALIYNGRLLDVYNKIFLPNYGVFDEKRYFYPGDRCHVISFGKQAKVGVDICEDIWFRQGPQRMQVRKGGANVIINISASPYYYQKMTLREEMLKKRAKENNSFVLYCNMAGGQDELVFDGGSLAFDRRGKLIARGKEFQEDLLTVDIGKDASPCGNRIEKKLGYLEEIYSALVLGLKDYVGKNGFKKVVFGLSGGIDSALTVLLAVDALGRQNVVALRMPSEYSSAGAMRDAESISRSLGIKLVTAPITGLHKKYLSSLKSHFKGMKPDITEENLQARIRGNILMAFSNKFKWLVLSTGNKSEVSTGYCTLYGDMVGGFALLKDVSKQLVYKLTEHRNALHGGKAIPKSVFTRPPSAELKRNQKDQDTLPPYPVLDKILDLYIEKDKSFDEIVRKGFSRETARKVLRMVDSNEYKRRQAPPGVKITPKAFGKDRRMPITNKFFNNI